MRDLLVQRGDKPSYRRMMRRDQFLATNEPVAGYGITLEQQTEDGTVIAVAGDDQWPHPWRVEAVGVPSQPPVVLARLMPGTVTFNWDSEEPILAANSLMDPPPPGEVWRETDVALSDAGAWHLHIDPATMPIAREVGRGLPEAIYNIAQATTVPGVERTARVAEVGLLADAMRPRGRRFTANMVPDAPRQDLSVLDRGAMEFFGLSALEPVLATWITLAEVWALAPMDAPDQRDFGPGWAVVVRQLECWNLHFGLLPDEAAPTEEKGLDPWLSWFIGRYTLAPEATLLEQQALSQMIYSWGLHKEPVAAWWT